MSDRKEVLYNSDLRDLYPPNNKQKPSPNVEPEKEPVKKIIKGTATQEKRSWKARMRDTFLGETALDIGDFVKNDIIVPAVKNMLADAVQTTTEMRLFGHMRGRSSNSGFYNYNKSYRNSGRSSSAYNRGLAAEPIFNKRTIKNFQRIRLEHRREVEDVLCEMQSRIDAYGCVSVLDLYSMLGLESTHIDAKHGWESLRNVQTIPERGGYLLEFPDPIPLD